MNAYELADELFNYLPSHDAEKFATMLRQQQAEIEALKAKTPADEEILTAIKEFSEEVMPYKEYENTYSDGWLDACIEIYSAVFAILRKAQE